MYAGGPLALKILVPTLDLAVALRVVRRGPHVRHPAEPDELLEVPGDELRVRALALVALTVGDDPPVTAARDDRPTAGRREIPDSAGEGRRPPSPAAEGRPEEEGWQ